MVVSGDEVAPQLDEADRARTRALSSESRQALLSVLAQSARPLDAAEAAAALGLHRNTARVHLEVLCALGVIERHVEEPSGRGRPRVLYEAPVALEGEASGADEAGAASRSHDRLAPMLAQQLTAMAGVSVAADLARRRRRGPPGAGEGSPAGWDLSAEEALDLVVEVLGELGLEPEADPGSESVHLHACPFVELDLADRAAAQELHLRLLRAVVAHLDVPLDVLGLDLLVNEAPCRCTARFAPRSSPLPLPRRRLAEERPRGGATVGP